jgi:aminoglycoside 6'-N-acetyltransferase I
MKITDLTPNDTNSINQVAAILVAAFREHWPDAWPDLNSALEEVRESFAPDRISRIALADETDQFAIRNPQSAMVVGWIGGISDYDGLVWELHPLAVHPDLQGHGIGRALVADLEAQVRARGGLTVTLGSDDTDDMTTLSGVDLYDPDPWTHIANITNLKGHPYEFYQKLGYIITGVVPDANGHGKPDLIMSKSVAPPPAASTPDHA